MSVALGLLAVVVAAPGALAALHLSVLTGASLLYREPDPAGAPRLRFLVMVPARNEELVLAEALVALAAERRDGDLVLVVADRCTDRTAEIARAHGALVLERVEGDPPGRAAALRDGLAWAADRPWDVVAFIDADTIVEPGFFAACEGVLATGGEVAQARSEAQLRSGPLAVAALAASAMGGVVVPRGRDRLGGWVRLKGSGMVLRRAIAERHPFGASGASEDGQLSLDLCLAGVVHRHIDSARIRYAPATDVASASVQKLRYESGRLYTARLYLPRLLRTRNRAALDASIHLASPPLAVAVLLLLVGAGLAWLAGWLVLAIGCGVLVALLAADVAVALLVVGAGPRVWLSLLLAPPYVLWKGWIQAKALLRVRSAARPYEPTPAVGETDGDRSWRAVAGTRHRNPALVFLVLLAIGAAFIASNWTRGDGKEELSTGPGGSDLTKFLPLPGDQVVLVPDGTYRGGSISAPHAATTGRYRGWLVLVAESKHQVVVDLAEDPLVLGPETSRILFVGFKFVNGTVVLQGASDVAFWHTEHSFPVEGWAAQLSAAGGDRQAVRELPHPTPTAVKIRPDGQPVSGIGFHGSDLHDIGDDGIIMNSVDDSVFEGLRIWDVEEKTFDPGFNPNPAIPDLLHNDSIQVTGAVNRVAIRDSYLGQAVQWGAQLGSIKDATFERLWMADSQGVALIHNVFPGYVLTGANREIRAWGNGRFDPKLDRFRLDIQGEARRFWPETLSTERLRVPANLVLDGAPPPGVDMDGRRMVDERQALEHPDNPANVWRERNPYDSWRGFFDFPGA